MAEELKHNVEVQKVHTVEVLISMRNLGGSPNYVFMVVSTTIWCISWRVYVIPHGPICIRVSLHQILTMLLSL